MNIGGMDKFRKFRLLPPRRRWHDNLVAATRCLRVILAHEMDAFDSVAHRTGGREGLVSVVP